MEMWHRFHVHRDHVGTSLHEVRDVAIGCLNHQVDVERFGGHALDGAHDDRADRDVGDKMAVHDVDVNEIGAAAFNQRDVMPERGEVGGENRRGDLNHYRLTSMEMASPSPT